VIYRRLLKADFDKLPRVLRDFHAIAGGRHAAGTVAVRHINTALARVCGFPPEGDDIPIRLEVSASDSREVWTRRFGDTALRTVQWISGEFLVESRGPVHMYLRVLAGETGMRFQSVRARCWGLPVPLRIEATTLGRESSWEIAVTVAPLGSYHGVVTPLP